MDYGKEFTLSKGMKAVRESLEFIENNYDTIVIEGAGSPAEVNLNDQEIVNMCIAEAADVNVILVTDIDRGGIVFGICGGYQMLGQELIDEFGVDIKGGKSVKGLGLLPVKTTFLKEKQVRMIKGKAIDGSNQEVAGYETHLGRTAYLD